MKIQLVEDVQEGRFDMSVCACVYIYVYIYTHSQSSKAMNLEWISER